jgi:hypothetical protein
MLSEDRAIDESNLDFRTAAGALHQGREFHEVGGKQKCSPESYNPSTMVNCFKLGDEIQAAKADFDLN